MAKNLLLGESVAETRPSYSSDFGANVQMGGQSVIPSAEVWSKLKFVEAEKRY